MIGQQANQLKKEKRALQATELPSRNVLVQGNPCIDFQETNNTFSFPQCGIRSETGSGVDRIIAIS
jgi:hypothetical protein